MGKTLSPSGHEIAGKRNQGQGDACGFVAVTFPGHDLDIRMTTALVTYTAFGFLVAWKLMR